VVKMLLEHGADLSLKDVQQRTGACCEQYTSLLTLFLQHLILPRLMKCANYYAQELANSIN